MHPLLTPKLNNITLRHAVKDYLDSSFKTRRYISLPQLCCARVSALHRDRRQFRGSIGSDGFEKVLIGTRGARETFLDGRKGRAAKNSVLSSGAKQLKLTVRGTQALLIGTRGAIETFLHWPSSRRATSE